MLIGSNKNAVAKAFFNLTQPGQRKGFARVCKCSDETPSAKKARMNASGSSVNKSCRGHSQETYLAQQSDVANLRFTYTSVANVRPAASGECGANVSCQVRLQSVQTRKPVPEVRIFDTVGIK